MSTESPEKAPRSRTQREIVAYVVALVIAIVIPVTVGAALLFERQVGDVALIERKSAGLEETVRVDALLRRLRTLRRIAVRLGRIELRDRLAVEAEMTRVRDDARGPARALGTTEDFARVLAVWHGVPEAGAGLRQVDRTIGATLNFERLVNARSSLHSQIGDRAAALLDAYENQMSVVGDRIDQEQNVIYSAYRIRRGLSTTALAVTIFSSQVDRAYRNAAFDVAIVGDARRQDPAGNAIAEVGRRLEEFRWRARSATSGSFQNPRSVAPLIIAGRALSGSIDASMVSLANEIQDELRARLDEQRDFGMRLRLGAVAALVCIAIFGFFLYRSLRDRRRTQEALRRSDAIRVRAEEERLRAERLLALTEARFEAVFDRTSVGIAIVDRFGGIVRANEPFGSMFEDEIPDVVGKQGDRFTELVSGTLAGYTFEASYVRSQRRRWMEADVSAIRDDASGTSFAVAIVKDVTDRYEEALRLNREARVDPLVNLPNRTSLIEYLESFLSVEEHDGVAGFAFVSLDEYDHVVSSLGRIVGERLLVDVATRLREGLERNDFAARVGASDFAIVLGRRADHTIVIARLQETLRKLELPYLIDDREIVVRPCAGLVEIEGSYDGVEALFADADVAAVAARERKSTHLAVFDPAMRERASRRVEVLGHLRRALDRDQLHLTFQPIVSLDDERVTAFEVLLRWDHPELGSVSPAEFVPLAEETGMIVAIGRWVFERTCAQMRAWRRSTMRTTVKYVSVNVSVGQLMRADFSEFVASTLARHALDGPDIVIEVTEGVLMLDGSEAQRNLDRLRAIGVRFSIDDFGTGFSSLRYLQAFDFDFLKIDQGFVRGASGTIESPEIVTMIAALGVSLGVTVVAEGIETAGQAAHLRVLGVTTGQGYLFGQAMSPASAEGLVTRQRTQASLKRSSR